MVESEVQQQMGQTDQINYPQLAQQRKQAQIDKVWNQVEQNPELKGIIKLKEKLEQNKKMRLRTTEMLHDMKNQYTGLKSNIRTYIQQQNRTANQLSVSTKKKPAVKQN